MSYRAFLKISTATKPCLISQTDRFIMNFGEDFFAAENVMDAVAKSAGHCSHEALVAAIAEYAEPDLTAPDYADLYADQRWDLVIKHDSATTKVTLTGTDASDAIVFMRRLEFGRG